MDPFRKNGGSACIACGCESLLMGALFTIVAVKIAPRLIKRTK